MANDEPVLPPVYSTTRIPGRNAPRRSAPSIMASAIRSLYDPVGLKYSSFTKTSAEPRVTSRCRCTSGVRPIVRSTESTAAGNERIAVDYSTTSSVEPAESATPLPLRRDMPPSCTAKGDDRASGRSVCLEIAATTQPPFGAVFGVVTRWLEELLGAS